MNTRMLLSSRLRMVYVSFQYSYRARFAFEVLAKSAADGFSDFFLSLVTAGWLARCVCFIEIPESL